jgi:DNA-binding transcriptional MerR regulator
MEKRIFRISEVARMLECSTEWLREAERIGKIPSPRRDINGWRVYTKEDIRQIEELLMPERE